jgi:hypothetical protein
VGFFDTAGHARGVMMVEGYAYLADGDDGLYILDCSPLTSGLPPQYDVPRAPSLSRCAPNPFHSATRIEVALPVPAMVELVVYDASGRMIATLFRGRETAGVKRHTWDGRDAAGRRVGAGAYFVRLRSRGRSVARKVVVLE